VSPLSYSPADYSRARGIVSDLLAQDPDLWWGGIWSDWHRANRPPGALEEERAKFLTPWGLNQFLRAEVFIGQAPRTKGINAKRSSYRWKHDVERFHRIDRPDADVYTGEGAFIAAALAAGLIVKRTRGGRHYVNLSEKAVPHRTGFY
jgi:hypothetical protein